MENKLFERSGEKSILYDLSKCVFENRFIKEILGSEFIDHYIKKNFLDQLEKYEKEENLEKKDESIANLIVELIRELFLKVNFTDGLAYDLLKAWKDYEDIIFDIKDIYREHFIHQYHDFLFGCLFLEKLWKGFSIYFNKIRFLRRWLFAAMFHDIGYPAESLDDIQDNLQQRFFNKIPLYGIRNIKLELLENKDENISKLLRNMALIHLFSENISFNNAGFDKYDNFIYPLEEIYNLFMDELRQTNDHGVNGSVFFLKTALIDLHEVVIDPNNSDKTTIFTSYEPVSHLLDDIFIAAAAISGHNLRVNTYPSYTVDFSTRPIAALLNFCDDLQNWDRRRRQGSKWIKGEMNLKSIEEKQNKLIITYNFDKDNSNNSLENKFAHTIRTLFKSNLSDLNCNFYEEIEIKMGKDFKVGFKLIKDTTNNTFIHRIGRYTEI